jgi:ribosomal protein S24E
MADVNILRKHEEPLMSRTIVEAEVAFTGAVPRRQDVKKSLAAKLGAAEDTIVLESIRPIFGQTLAVATVSVYKDKKVMGKLAGKHLADRDAGKKGGAPKEKKAAKAEAKAEAKPEAKAGAKVEAKPETKAEAKAGAK